MNVQTSQLPILTTPPHPHPTVSLHNFAEAVNWQEQEPICARGLNKELLKALREFMCHTQSPLPPKCVCVDTHVSFNMCVKSCEKQGQNLRLSQNLKNGQLVCTRASQ